MLNTRGKLKTTFSNSFPVCTKTVTDRTKREWFTTREVTDRQEKHSATEQEMLILKIVTLIE